MSYGDFVYPIISGVELGILVYSPAFIIEWANDYVKKLIPHLDLSGDPCYNQIYGKKEPCKDCIIQKVFKTRLPQEREIQFKDSKHWYLEKAYPIIGDNKIVQYVFETIQDITEYKEYQITITENEKKYREMINFLPQVYFEFDLRGKITESNLFAIRKFGYTEKDIQNGINMAEIIHPEDRKRAFIRLHKLYKNSSRYKGGSVYRLISKNGKQFYGSIYTALKTEEKKTIGFRGVIVDIDERIKMEQKLISSEEKYRSVVERSNDGIILVRDEKFLYVNEAGLNMTGLKKAEELINQSIYDFLPDEKREYLRQKHYSRLRGDKVPDRYEIDILNAQNEFIPVEISVSLINLDGKTTALGFIRDLRMQKEAERKIQESVSDFRMVISQISDVFWKIEFNQNRKAINYFMSPSFERVFGIKESDLKVNLKILISRIHRDDRKIFIQTINQIKRGKIENFYYEYRITREYGIYSWFINKGKIQKQKGGNIIAFGITADIDRQKRMELESKTAREKAEEAVKVKSRFLANMSHEIRTPLNSIIGMTDLAFTTTSLSEINSYLNQIKESTNHLLGVINQILDFSKVDSGKISIELISFHLRDLIHSVTDTIRASLLKKNVTLKIDISDKIPVHVLSDPVKIRQILTNLLDNSVKFTKEGYIHLKVNCNHFAEKKASIQFEIEDTGIGIKNENLSYIFESFRQAESSIYRNFGGTGLGLSITKAYVNLLGGDISVYSEYGIGTRFVFNIPVQVLEFKPKLQRLKNDIKIDANVVHHLKNTRDPLFILVAEDNEDNINLIKLVLKKTGHKFDIVTNGIDVLKNLDKKKYDIILMDIEMPLKNGLDTTKEIREGSYGINNPKIPILAMTAHVIPEVKEKCAQVGMDGYIEKPLNIFRLEDHIQKVLKK